MTSEWLPAATLAAGVLGTLGGQGLTGWLTLKRDEGARGAEREVARDAFQRETLLELQDAVLVLLQNTTRIHVHQGQVYRDTQRFGRDYLPDDLNDASGEVQARTSRLKQRVLDQRIREEVDSLKAVCSEITFPTLGDVADNVAKAAAQDAWVRMGTVNAQIEERIGAVLRSLL